MSAEVASYASLTIGRSVVHDSKLYTASEPVSADNAGAAAIALNAGLDKVQRALVAWTLEQAEAAAAKVQD